MLKENLTLLAGGQDPKTGYFVEDTILTSSFNKRILSNAAYVIDQLLRVDFNPTRIDKRKNLTSIFHQKNVRKFKSQMSPYQLVFSHIE